MWRGSTTGAGGPKSYPKLIDGNKIGQDTGSFSQRAQLVRRIPYFDEHFSEILDVGVTEYVQGVPALWGTKGELTRGEQIRHKMIIIAEGNDVGEHYSTQFNSIQFNSIHFNYVRFGSLQITSFNSDCHKMGTHFILCNYNGCPHRL